MYVFTITSSSGIDREKKFFFREILIIFRGAFKFHIISVCHNEFCWEAAISVYVVLSCGLRETSRVDYTERRKSERILIVFLLKSGGGGDFVPPSSGGAMVVLPLPPPLPYPLPLPPPPKKKGKRGRRGREGKRVWTDCNVFQQVWTCFDRFERVNLNGLKRVSTGFNRSERVSTGLNGLQYAVCFFCDNNNTVEKHLFFLIQSIYFS